MEERFALFVTIQYCVRKIIVASLPLIAGNRADNKKTFSHLPNIPPPPHNVIYIYEWYWYKSITYCAGGGTFWSCW
jgi:hypothetical protein